MYRGIRGPYRLAYELQEVSARHGSEFYTGGTSKRGTLVLERWELPSEPGAYFTTRDFASSPIGIPVPYAPIVGAVAGDTYIPPARRTPREPIRTIVFRGPDISGIRDFAVDPEGRFLLVLTTSPVRILRIIGDDDPPVVTLFDADDIAGLDETWSIQPFQHESEGRKYLLSSGSCDPPGVIVLLNDRENDGVFEDHRVLTNREYEESEYGPDSWVDDYLNYRFE